MQHPGSRRDAIAWLVALLTILSLGAALAFSRDTQFLMPGPLASAHGAIEDCSACHTKSGSGKMGWSRGIVAGDPHADSQACLTCHAMPATAFNAHGASKAELAQSTDRRRQLAASIPAPLAARVQTALFPTDGLMRRDISCATCHQEHQGARADLKAVSSEQCRSCHTAKFDSFDGQHPQFDDYPFTRRTRIVFDHSGHFDKHFPEVAKKDGGQLGVTNCSACHDSGKDRRVMAVASFDASCSQCHLDQITGKDRASGPKGIAFLTLPGLDLATLKSKNAAIGAWPEASEAALTPFMKVMLSRDEPGRALLETLATIDLQDLSSASDGEIAAVTDLVWRIKGLFHAMVTGKASDVLDSLASHRDRTVDATLLADLTASIPRDVIASAQTEWLPNLADEMAKGRDQAGLPQDDTTSTETTGSQAAEADATATERVGDIDQPASDPAAEAQAEPDEPLADADAQEVTSSLSSERDRGRKQGRLDPPPCSVSFFGQCLLSEELKNSAETRVPGDAPAPGALTTTMPEPADGTLPPAMKAGLEDVVAANAAPRSSKETATAEPGDDLLFPTKEELEAINAHHKAAGQVRAPDAIGGNGAATAADGADAAPQAANPSLDVESDVDPETWADYGGWYRQDYSISYRPRGHKDKFIYAWLVLTGPQSNARDASPAAAVFRTLAAKDAQGACTKCHSVDDLGRRGGQVNFAPLRAETKRGRFTRFIHEPHLGMLDDRGCLTCHELAKDARRETATGSGGKATQASAQTSGLDYLQSYEHGDPTAFASGFGAVEKQTCQTCHTAAKARQDCLLCHNYHVNGVVTPTVGTKLPLQ